MWLRGKNVLDRAMKKYGNARKVLKLWADTVGDAQWGSLHEMQEDFPSADGVKLGSGVTVTVFNVKGNEYRLLVRITYALRIVEVLEFLTHAEYSKDKWKERY